MKRWIGRLMVSGCMLVLSCLAREGRAAAEADRMNPELTGYASAYPEYHARWIAAIDDGTNAFLKLLASSAPRIDDREKMTVRSLRDVYLEAGLSPWIAFAEKDQSDTRVTPSGKLHLSFHATFSAVIRDPDRTASISDFAVRPIMPYLLGDSSTGWMPGRTKQGTPEINGWIDQSVWLKVPADVEPGSLTFTAHALTYGSQSGTLRQKEEKQPYTVQIVAPPVPTKENILCMWAYGIDQGKWLSANPGKSVKERGLRKRQLLWVEELLQEFAQDASVSELVAGVRRHPAYVENVAAYLEEIKAAE